MRRFLLAGGAALILTAGAAASDGLHEGLSEAISVDYENSLRDLFIHFHENPELSFAEKGTAALLASELRSAGFDVTEGVGGTGLVAMMENGDGPLVMMRADMDALPIKEKSGLEYASTVVQAHPGTGEMVPVMHACGHDVHITSLIGTARRMAAMRDRWSGTLMLVGQPAEEVGPGAEAMKDDKIWERFGQPDYAFAFHVAAAFEAGKIAINEGAPYAGVDSVDIIVHGIGSHGAAPHSGKDPVVLGSQIVLALQTLVARELPPREPGVVTVGSFHSGYKHNIISDRAVLQVTVRNTNEKTRRTLLDGIKRIAENMGRVAGLPEDKLPEVIYHNNSYPPTVNTAALARRAKLAVVAQMGEGSMSGYVTNGMGGEDFPFFTNDPYIPSVYFRVGGTPKAAFEAEAAGGPAVPSHHSPLFKVDPDASVPAGIEATVAILMDMMPK